MLRLAQPDSIPYADALNLDPRDMSDWELDESRRIMGASKLLIRVRDGVPPHGWLHNAKGNFVHTENSDSLRVLEKLAPLNKRIDALNIEYGCRQNRFPPSR